MTEESLAFYQIYHASDTGFPLYKYKIHHKEDDLWVEDN